MRGPENDIKKQKKKTCVYSCRVIEDGQFLFGGWKKAFSIAREFHLFFFSGAESGAARQGAFDALDAFPKSGLERLKF